MSSAEETAMPPQAEQPKTPSFAMLRTLGGIAILAGFLVVMVYQWTKPIIEENKRIAIEKAVFTVVPGAASRKDFLLGSEGLSTVADNGQGEKIYAAYNEKGELQGIALEAAATGYQDVIRILYGYNPACECVTGIKVLKMAETPGLGDKIAFDPEFLKNFEILDAKLNTDKSGLVGHADNIVIMVGRIMGHAHSQATSYHSKDHRDTDSVVSVDDASSRSDHAGQDHSATC